MRGQRAADYTTAYIQLYRMSNGTGFVGVDWILSGNRKLGYAETMLYQYRFSPAGAGVRQWPHGLDLTNTMPHPCDCIRHNGANEVESASAEIYYWDRDHRNRPRYWNLWAQDLTFSRPTDSPYRRSQPVEAITHKEVEYGDGNGGGANYAKLEGPLKVGDTDCTDQVHLDFRSANIALRSHRLDDPTTPLHGLKATSFTGNLPEDPQNPNGPKVAWYHSGPLPADEYEITVTWKRTNKQDVQFKLFRYFNSPGDYLGIDVLNQRFIPHTAGNTTGVDWLTNLPVFQRGAMLTDCPPGFRCPEDCRGWPPSS